VYCSASLITDHDVLVSPIGCLPDTSVLAPHSHPSPPSSSFSRHRGLIESSIDAYPAPTSSAGTGDQIASTPVAPAASLLGGLGSISLLGSGSNAPKKSVSVEGEHTDDNKVRLSHLILTSLRHRCLHITASSAIHSVLQLASLTPGVCYILPSFNSYLFSTPLR
jgi:hypothetical protein